jgi:hypothetical protein
MSSVAALVYGSLFVIDDCLGFQFTFVNFDGRLFCFFSAQLRKYVNCITLGYLSSEYCEFSAHVM